MYRESVRQVMPDTVKRLWDEVEQFSGVDVYVFEARAGDTAACNPNHLGSSIFLPDPLNPVPADVAHELLHIRRYWVRKVPQLSVVEDLGENRQFICHLEANLEHVIIVPEFNSLGMGPDPQRKADARLFFEAEIDDSARSKAQVLSAAIGIEANIYEKEDGEAIKLRLKQTGNLKVRGVARKIVQAVRHDKRAASKLYLDYFGIPHRDVEFLIYDIKNRNQISAPL